ncbi:MAG: class B sortase [Lachnospiraceae bacterium]
MKIIDLDIEDPDEKDFDKENLDAEFTETEDNNDAWEEEAWNGDWLSETGKDIYSTKWRKLQTVGIVFLLAVMVVALVKIFLIFSDYHKAEQIYEETNRKYVIQIDGNNGGDLFPQEKPAQGNPVQEEPMWYEIMTVDLKALQEVNPDVIGWIYFENEKISYPILYSGDNETYLRKTYTGENVTAGSIFMDGAGCPDFSDRHVILYGHNMKDLSMFGRLRYYKTEEDYYEDHRFFQIYTEGMIYRYEIFAYKEVPEDSAVYTILDRDAQGLFDFAKDILCTGSYIQSGIYVSYDDHVITLSTCTADEAKRFIVCAVRTDQKEVLY